MNGLSNHETRPAFEGSIHVPSDTNEPPRPLLFSKHMTRTPNRTATRHTNPFWVLDCHVRNAGEYSLDGRSWKKRASNTVHLYAPGTIYWERSHPRDVPFEETYFIFQSGTPGILEQRVAPGNGFARFFDPLERVAESVDFFLGNARPTPSAWAAQGLLLRVLELLISARHMGGFHYTILPASVPPDESLSGRVDAYLCEHFHERISLDRLAADIGVSRSTLSHRYRRETGITPAARLSEIRLDAARAMILKGERLKIVAPRTGFCDEYHLSKAFRRRFGSSPRAFRNQIPSGGDGGPGNVPRSNPDEGKR